MHGRDKIRALVSFRPLLGAYFFIRFTVASMPMSACFRPLLGAYFFIYQVHRRSYKEELVSVHYSGLILWLGIPHKGRSGSVSVPYSGLIFLLAEHLFIMKILLNMFPSPIRGFFYGWVYRTREEAEAFPSPARGLFFYSHRLHTERLHVSVSVPCSGLIFLSGRSQLIWALVRSFRPLFGAYFFIQEGTKMKEKMTFPSPTRGLFFYKRKGYCSYRNKHVSVPYSGLIFLLYKITVMVLKIICFRPLFGAYFLF